MLSDCDAEGTAHSVGGGLKAALMAIWLPPGLCYSEERQQSSPKPRSSGHTAKSGQPQSDAFRGAVGWGEICTGRGECGDARPWAQGGKRSTSEGRLSLRRMRAWHANRNCWNSNCTRPCCLQALRVSRHVALTSCATSSPGEVPPALHASSPWDSCRGLGSKVCDQYLWRTYKALEQRPKSTHG